MAKDGRRLRCAIYTRKSSEEGLDKEFNSLDAQHEACAAYVMSQQHEGWTLVSDVYDDGGYSRGNLDRPAFQQLLADVRAGRIDVVVIYRIDRLTRSLSDFAKIVDALDAAEASFVSVTQSFSTTSSMGRLTLNVLLSFAQFEREVIAERIRDKVAASKAKGMWMGGGVPLGYAVSDRKLVAVPEEATAVRLIMERYLASDSVRNLLDELRPDGMVSKRRQARDSSIKGGVPFRRGALYWLLSNRIYIGETVHKGTAYPGQHDAIVSRELFDAVQAKLAKSVGTSAGGSRKAVSLFAGMIRDDRGRPMSPCHTRNHGRRYSYYASNMGDDASATALRLPAGELDATVRVEISKWLDDGEETRALVSGLDASATSSLFDTCAGLAGRIVHAPIGEAREILRQLGLKVRVSSSEAAATFDTRALLSMAGLSGVEGAAVQLIIPTTQASYGHEPRLRLEPAGHHDKPRDERLVELIARAFAARNELLEMDSGGVAAMPVTRLRHLQRTARLSYLDPAIIRSILDGTQPKHLSSRALWRMAELPLGWAAQRQALQFPAA